MQTCHVGYRVSYSVHTVGILGRVTRTPTKISTRGCFNTGVFQDISIETTLSSIEIQLTALEKYSSLSEIQLFIGKDKAIFQAPNLVQDSSKTWLVPDKNNPEGFQFDFMEISGYAHVGLLSFPTFNSRLTVSELGGDHTGTLHIGAEQNINITVPWSMVLPFNIQTYKVQRTSCQI